MSLFAGIGAGWGKGQGEYNSRMLDFINQKNQNLATMYGHLADNAQDQDMASEFMNRAQGWASANPLLDPKGYKELIKREKVGLHDIVDQAHQKKVDQFHQETFNLQPQKQQQQPQQAKPSAPDAFDMAAPPTQAEQASQAPPPVQGQQPGQVPAAPQQSDMDQFIRHTLPPEPPMYGSLGRLNPEWQHWHEIYTKKMEGTVPTPQAWQGFVGAPFMSAGFASPYASVMRTEAMAGARAIGQGYKLVNGQFIPLQPDEYSLAQQLKMGKDQAQTESLKASVPLRQMMTEYYGTKTKILPMELKARLMQLDVLMQRAKTYELNVNAHLFGRDLQGNPIPGALALDDGTGNVIPIGSVWSSNVKPTVATQGKAEMAIPVMEQTNKLYDFASNPANADLFGKVQGNMEAFIAGRWGTGDPREGALRADLISLASLMVPLHGFRSQKAAEEFLARLGQGMSPDAFMASVRAFNGVGMQLYSNGMPSLINSQGGSTRRMPLPPGQSGASPAVNPPPTSKFSVGQVFAKGNKKYKVTKVLPDGGVEATEVP